MRGQVQGMAFLASRSHEFLFAEKLIKSAAVNFFLASQGLPPVEDMNYAGAAGCADVMGQSHVDIFAGDLSLSCLSSHLMPDFYHLSDS
jgi:hypothetical protein